MVTLHELFPDGWWDVMIVLGSWTYAYLYGYYIGRGFRLVAYSVFGIWVIVSWGILPSMNPNLSPIAGLGKTWSPPPEWATVELVCQLSIWVGLCYLGWREGRRRREKPPKTEPTRVPFLYWSRAPR